LDRAVALCWKHRHVIAKVAERLAEHHVSGDDVRHLLSEAVEAILGSKYSQRANSSHRQ
jgi:hypothetical protein